MSKRGGRGEGEGRERGGRGEGERETYFVRVDAELSSLDPEISEQ